MFFCSDCCVLLGRGLCDELITRPEECYRLWCVVVWSRKPQEWGGHDARCVAGPQKKNIYIYVCVAGPSGRAVYGEGVRPLACWDRVFESHRGHGCLLWVLCVLRQRSLRRADHSSRGVLPTVLLRCVWSRNLKNEEAMTRVGSQRHRKKNAFKEQWLVCTSFTKRICMLHIAVSVNNYDFLRQ
jgi:hypothetical protein